MKVHSSRTKANWSGDGGGGVGERLAAGTCGAHVGGIDLCQGFD